MCLMLFFPFRKLITRSGTRGAIIVRVFSEETAVAGELSTS